MGGDNRSAEYVPPPDVYIKPAVRRESDGVVLVMTASGHRQPLERVHFPRGDEERQREELKLKAAAL